MQSWRQAQQALATRAARDEEQAISGWWRQEAEQLWALQSQRRRDHVELAKRQEAELDDRENQGADVRLRCACRSGIGCCGRPCCVGFGGGSDELAGYF